MEDAVLAAFEAELPPALSPLLAGALLLPWHFRHEDIAVALERMKDPHATAALATAALLRPPYLLSDEHRGLARKCMRALTAIGNAEAREKLEALAQSDDDGCARLARRQLHHFRAPPGR